MVVTVLLLEVADTADTGDQEWARYVYVLSGLEAVVFAAVGWLFGKEVNRKRAEAAEGKAQHAEETRDKAEQEKSEARAKEAAATRMARDLAHAIGAKHEAVQPAAAARAEGAGGERPVTPPSAEIAELDKFAQRLLSELEAARDSGLGATAPASAPGGPASQPAP